MITDPKYGWASFRLGNFSSSVSCLSDVPFDLMDAFRKVLKNPCKTVSVSFDCEGSMFHLLITNTRSYIISEKDKTEFFVIDRSSEDLAQELVKDIESDIDGWVNFLLIEETAGNRTKIIRKLSSLRAQLC